MSNEYLPITPVYGRPEFTDTIDFTKAELLDDPLSPDSVYQLIKNELLLDGRAGLNLATFCNEAYTDPWGKQIIMDSINKNFIDHEEFPAMNLIEKRSIWMLAKELGTTFDPDDTDPGTAKGLYGAATIGSSEAVMLGLIAHKYKWNANNQIKLHSGKADPQDKPVVLMSAHVHGCWDKFCNYYGALPLYIKIDKPPYAVTGDEVADILKTKIEDTQSPYAAILRKKLNYMNKQGDRTIGELVMCVGAVVGSTFTGNCDDVIGIDQAVDQYCASAPSALNIDIPVHVDAASAGFVLMFSHNGQDITFNFKGTKRVLSINTSNHKFGMTFPGMGSVIFKNSKVVDPSLIYTITYLGGSFIDYTVNFSRGSSMIVMQYYNFLRFGRSGYTSIMNNCLNNTKSFLNQISESTILSPVIKNISNAAYLPIIVLTWADGAQKPPWTLRDLSDLLRQKGWIVPSYVLPVNTPEDIVPSDKGTEVLRIVVQQIVSNDKLNMLFRDMEEAVHDLDDTTGSRKSKNVMTGYKC